MKGFRDQHLGEHAAGLVDGELGPQARDAALAHLARCDRCRADVAAQRRLKARLGGLATPPEPPDLAARLLALAPERLAQHPAVSGAAGVPVTAGPSRPPGRGDARRGDPRRTDARRPGGRRRRAVRLAVAGGASLVALGVTAFAAGGGSGPAVVPDVRQLTVEHASTTGEVPFELPIPNAPGVSFRQVSVP